MEFIDLKAQYKKLDSKINNNIKKVLNDSHFIMGEEVKTLEKELADYVGVKYCLTCANGTDALTIALMALGIKAGDAVFVPSFTFFSTAEVVSLAGATPIFVDSDQRTFNIDFNKLEKAIIKAKNETNLNLKAIIAVDLFGLPANFKEIKRIAEKYNLLIIEDGAQGFGGSIDGKKACSFGDIATTSFFPAKPLGCYGDGGAIFTNNKDYYDLMESIRVHGKGTFKYDNVRIGLNSRLDTLQAAILLPKLEAFKEYELDERNKFAKMYTDKLKDYVKTPFVDEGFVSSWAQYTLIFDNKDERDYVQNRLKDKGIPSMIYYCKPMHKQSVYADYSFNLDDLCVSESLSDTVLSLPMHPYMSGDQINDICNAVLESIEDYKNGK